MDNLAPEVHRQTLVSQERKFIGYFDLFEEGIARGWAYDEANPLKLAALHVISAGQEIGMIRCDQQRDDIKSNLAHPTGRVGFLFGISLDGFDGEPHRIDLRFKNGAVVSVFDKSVLECAG